MSQVLPVLDLGTLPKGSALICLMLIDLKRIMIVFKFGIVIGVKLATSSNFCSQEQGIS